MASFAPTVQAAFIFLTSATAVSIAGMRVSDISAALLLASLFLHRTSEPRRRGSAIALFLAILLSTLVSFSFQLLEFEQEAILSGLPNAISIPFSLLLSITFLYNCSKKRALKIASAYCSITLVACYFVFVWQSAIGRPAWLNAAEVAERFSALSNNPNQLALFLLPIPFFSIFCYLNGFRRRNLVIIDIVASALLNALIIGKGLFFSWLLSAVFMLLTGFVFRGSIRISLNFILTRSILIVAFGFAIAPVAFLLYTGNTPGSQEGQGSIRVALWMNGLLAWTEAPLFGHGPGHYSGLEIPYSGMEAHNFFIDWGSAYGLLGSFALLLLFSLFFAQAFKGKTWIICAFYIALLVQIIFHFYGRQPVFWLWWAFGFLFSLTRPDIAHIKPAEQPPPLLFKGSKLSP